MRKTPLVRVRGIRQVVPSGFMLGRVSPGDGDVELIPISQVAHAAVASGIVPSAGASAAGPMLGITIPNNLNLLTNQYFPLAILHQNIMLPAAVPADIVKCRVAPAENVIFDLVQDITTYEAGDTSSGSLARITILAGATTGTVVWAGVPALIVLGTVLYLYSAPANAQTALSTTIIGLEILFTADNP